MSNSLQMWTVYDRPSDYPQGFIARRYDITNDGVHPTEDKVHGPNLSNVRMQLHHLGLSPAFLRSDGDAPSVVETWW